MIYITYKYNEFSEHEIVNNLWEIDIIGDVESLYKEYMISKAKDEFDIIINHHWLNIMNYKDHNSHLSKSEYNKKEKLWNKCLLKHTVDFYISEILKGKKLEYINLY